MQFVWQKSSGLHNSNAFKRRITTIYSVNRITQADVIDERRSQVSGINWNAQLCNNTPSQLITCRFDNQVRRLDVLDFLLCGWVMGTLGIGAASMIAVLLDTIRKELAVNVCTLGGVAEQA